MIKKLITILFVSVFITSCNSDNQETFGQLNCDNNENSTDKIETFVSMGQYDEYVVYNKSVLTDFYLTVSDDCELDATEDIDTPKKEACVNLTSTFYPVAKQFAEEIGLTNEDLEDIYDVKIVTEKDKEYALT